MCTPIPTPTASRCFAGTASLRSSCISDEARALSAGAHDRYPCEGSHGLRRFCLPGGDSPEPETPETVSASRLLRPGTGRLLLRSQAQIAAQRGKRRLAPAVPDTGVNRRSSPRPAPAGAVLPGVRPSRRPHSGHRRGPHPAPQGRLGFVHGPEQPAIPVPLMPQPQNDGGKARKMTPEICAKLCPNRARLGAHA